MTAKRVPTPLEALSNRGDVIIHEQNGKTIVTFHGEFGAVSLEGRADKDQLLIELAGMVAHWPWPGQMAACCEESIRWKEEEGGIE